jgi:uncharacterized iron-regulated membrane protein
MKTQTLLRKIHHWGSFLIALPLIIMIGAGVLLMIKKEVEWIQPSSLKGIERQAVPMASMQELFDAALTVEKASFTNWEQLKRADLKPGKGIIKFVSETNWEVQVDTHTSEVLQVAQRRSDVIEAIHDGSYFADWVKLGIFLPAGVGLFVLWITGIYLFVTIELKKIKNRRRSKTV